MTISSRLRPLAAASLSALSLSVVSLPVVSLVAAGVGGCGHEQMSGPSKTPIDLPAGSFTEVWHESANFDNDAKATGLTLSGGVLLLTSDANQAVGFDLGGATTFRSVAAPGDAKRLGRPIVTKSGVAIPTSSTIEYYSPKGSLVRTIELGTPIRSAPAVLDDVLFLGTDSETGGRLSAIEVTRAYNFADWELLTGSLISSRPVVKDALIYAATRSGDVYAVTRERRPLWASRTGLEDSIFHTGGSIYGDLAIDDGGLYVPCTDGTLYALDASSGKIRWKYLAGVALEAPVFSSNDFVLTHVPSMGLVAIDKTGSDLIRQPKWNNTDVKSVLSTDEQHVYVVMNDGHIAALSKADGSVAFTSAGADYDFFAVHLDSADPTIFAAKKDGTITAIKPVLKEGTRGIQVRLDVPTDRTRQVALAR